MQSGITEDKLAERYAISQSMVSAAAKKNRKLLKRHRKSIKYLELYLECFGQFKTVLAKGRKVNFNLLWKRARTIQRKLAGEETAVNWKYLITTFLELVSCLNGCQTTKQKQTKGSLLG